MDISSMILRPRDIFSSSFDDSEGFSYSIQTKWLMLTIFNFRSRTFSDYNLQTISTLMLTKQECCITKFDMTKHYSMIDVQSFPFERNSI